MAVIFKRTKQEPISMNDTTKQSREKEISMILQHAETQREDLKLVDMHLERLSKRVLLGSIVAYFVFAALCIVAAYLWVDISTGRDSARMEALERTLNISQEELAETRKRIDENNVAARERSEKIAIFFDWFLGGEHEKIIKEGRQIADIAQTPLERLVVNHINDDARKHAGFQAYAEGVYAYNSGELDEAIKSLTKAIKYEGTGPYIPALLYYLGSAHYKKADYRQATIHLEAMLQADEKKKFRDDHALFRLGHAHELLKRTAQAKVHYTNLLKSFPKSQYAGLVRSKLQQM